MGITLKQLIEELEKEGVVGEEAEAAVERFLEMKRKGESPNKSTALAKKPAHEIDFPYSTQLQKPTRGGVPVDYGDETPEQAERRWTAQEIEDPDGIFAGGSTAGGIFGDAPIATPRYDPQARARTAQLRGAEQGAKVQLLTVEVLTKLAERLGVDMDTVAALLPEHDRRKLLKGRGGRG
jgi:hypothetical protein